MSKVSVNAPRTPVTKGSGGIASATLPNVCKVPGPPAPFVPTPLPNIGKSGKDPKDYSKTVLIEGKEVAIAGASFGSVGDVASKGTGGGLISANVEGPTKFIGPGSFDVQIEGKNVQLLGDPMLNNCGPSGAPPNAATMTGVMQPSGVIEYRYADDMACARCRKVHDGIRPTRQMVERMGDLFERLNLAVQEQIPRLRNHPADIDALDAVDPLSPEHMKISHRMAQLENDALLKWVGRYQSFVGGYMIGIATCFCTNRKPIAAASGDMPHGFARIAQECGFDVAARTSGAPINWQCAGRKIMEFLAGHQPKTMLERWFNPPTLNPNFEGKGPELIVEITYVNAKTGKQGTFPQPRRPGDGQDAPSCDHCQGKIPGSKGLPSLYCRDEYECG